MLDNATLASLHALKLVGFADGLQEQRTRTDLHSMSFEERLALLVDREIASRADRKRARLLQRARLKAPSACIEDADFTDLRGLDRRPLTSLALSNWIDNGEAVLLGGPTGVGKTWIACALGQYACRRGRSALYLRVPRLAEELKALRASGGLRRWLADLARTELLILDDWGTGSLDPAMRSDLLEIIDDRAGERATVLTHQLPVEHWHGWIGDATIADAILDRLMQRVHRFTLEGPSRRTAARPAKARPKADPAAAGTRTREDER